ncbi:NaeI family type II restriction endonuclease [Saccharopolyspora sp. MS10]|uniref:NaeI family type II restriction endonuclease n=1 Tax=Saccharopolyspora sp. MS10 TaxID=3385973 RepID=UPI0039A3E09A
MPADFSLFTPADDGCPASEPTSETAHEDVGLREVAAWFRAQRNYRERFGAVLRQSIDEVLDGQRTGRYDIEAAEPDGLSKTEKTYLGTKVEIITRAEFDLPQRERSGKRKPMDYCIAGHEVDAKFSLSAVWQIPQEAMGHLCLLMAARDRRQSFDIGLLRITEEVLNRGRNRDRKATISKAGRDKIIWLAAGAELPRNILLHLPEHQAKKIMSQTSGQRRINELLRTEQGRMIDRNTALTVAKQADGLKRCRDARPALRDEGIVVLGHQNDSRRIAVDLGLQIPMKGTFIAVQLARVTAGTSSRKTTIIDEACYAVAEPDDPVTPAPLINN